MFKRPNKKQDFEEYDRERIRADLKQKRETMEGSNERSDKLFRKMIFEKLGQAKNSEQISAIVNHCNKSTGISYLMIACIKGWTDIVQKLLTYKELDVNYQNLSAAFCAIQANSIECFEALTKCERVDWNIGSGQFLSVAFYAATMHRVEMIRALSQVKNNRVNWNFQDEEGDGIAHAAILSMKNSCYQILDILLEIPDFNINQRNNSGQTPLTHALGKQDYRALIKLFNFPNLNLYESDFDFASESMEDIDILIDECFKAYRETGYNYSDVVDFLREYKKYQKRSKHCIGTKDQQYLQEIFGTDEYVEEMARILTVKHHKHKTTRKSQKKTQGV